MLIKMEHGEEEKRGEKIDGATRLEEERCEDYRLQDWSLRVAYEVRDPEKNESVSLAEY